MTNVIHHMPARLLRIRDRVYEHLRPALDAAPYIGAVAGKEGLEIGGPSAIFRNRKLIPVYQRIARLDGVNFSAKTVWEGQLREGRTYEYLAGREPGWQFILDATDLRSIPSARYDFVLSSHALEHVANPIRALKEWMRVMKRRGVLLLVLPERTATFDHRRAPTTLGHLIADYERGTTEADLTHLPEILALHDLSMDAAAGDLESFRRRSLDNFTNRCLHHHVFDLASTVALVNHVGLQVLEAETVWPCHIIVLARNVACPASISTS
jgi:SAM-dependent methyltransferase